MIHVVFHLLKYLKGITTLGLFYPLNNNLMLVAFVDSDWGSSHPDHRFVLGYCSFLVVAFISWKSVRQPTVSTSITEAEYRAHALATKEILWIYYVL